MKSEFFKCPKCGGDKVTVSHKQRVMANTGEHYCHSVKAHDAGSESTCLECQWIGRRDQLVVHNASLSGLPLEASVGRTEDDDDDE